MDSLAFFKYINCYYLRIMNKFEDYSFLVNFKKDESLSGDWITDKLLRVFPNDPLTKLYIITERFIAILNHLDIQPEIELDQDITKYYLYFLDYYALIQSVYEENEERFNSIGLKASFKEIADLDKLDAIENIIDYITDLSEKVIVIKTNKTINESKDKYRKKLSNESGDYEINEAANNKIREYFDKLKTEIGNYEFIDKDLKSELLSDLENIEKQLKDKLTKEEYGLLVVDVMGFWGKLSSYGTKILKPHIFPIWGDVGYKHIYCVITHSMLTPRITTTK